MGPRQDNMTDKEPFWAIPKLAPDSSNWVTIKTRFMFTMAGRDFEGHFDGSEPPPWVPSYSSPDKSRWTTANKEENKTYLPLAKKWKHDENVVHAQLTQVVSNSLLIWIQHAGTVADMWKTIIAEFDHKGRMVQVDLHCHMMEKCATETDDIRAHLDKMALSHECLSGMGAAIHDEDYASMILMSLPDSYTTHLETLADAAGSSGRTFTASDFITKAMELSGKRQL